ncbi:kinase non-catalytic C-lobe domain-containing protein 1 [Orycteropus afer afer]|uniref:Kinase non-catalytic C-lobe domain-containing protein 1 n=1 Tax=Orycteropus afer afer TaxID=1230840 RepID=A0A8B6ZHD1_ORYAF|nr:kinase non-catalytic C-lobe domain-containing protein 1 [Orycteropus afer afer]
MQALEPAAAGFYEEDGRDLDFYDFQPLPTLPEDEENVSLADILSLRDSGLREQEAWAVCLECCLAMRSVAHSAIFQTLCITPDTLAFNTSGNVCFTEQLSDDPEGAFVPPEFDVTGNTFEAHIYSLGATLKAAVEYVPEAELEPKLSVDLETLLSQMQAEKPGDRPQLESIIALCEERMKSVSSCHLCRSLSALGRRVLSIESFGALQDVSENTWMGRFAPRSAGPKGQSGNRGADPKVQQALQGLPVGGPGSPQQESSWGVYPPPSKPLLSAPVRNGESDMEGPCSDRLAGLLLDTRGPLGDLDRGPLRRNRLRKVQSFPRLLADGPEASALCLSLTGSQRPVPELLPGDCRKIFPEGKNGLLDFKALPKYGLWPEGRPESQDEAQGTGGRRDRGTLPGIGPSGGSGLGGPSQGGAASPPEQPAEERCPQPDGASSCLGPGPAEEGPPPHPVDLQGTGRPHYNAVEALEGASQPGGIATEQWVALQDLLVKLGRPFREYELWALCHESLHTLQTYIEFPAYLCLDSVLIAEDGAVLFGTSPASGSYNSLFLAPEVTEEKLVTEKASVYCVAAVLWTAARFSMPRDHKLALPRRLKALLLDMARCSPQERLSAAEAIKVSNSYLLQRGMDSKKILAHLRGSTCKVYQEEETISLQNPFSMADLEPHTAPPPEPSAGFVPVGRDARLAAVRGPVPGKLTSGTEAGALPTAFTSAATHFKPILLAQDAADERALGPGSAERPEERRGREGRGTLVPEAHEAVTSTNTPERPAPGAEPRDAAPEQPGESAEERSCPASPVPAHRPAESATSQTPSSPVRASPPASPGKAQAQPEQRPEEPTRRGATSGGPGPAPPGAPAASLGPRRLPKAARGTAAELPDQEPEGPRRAAQASPNGPRGSSGRERPRPADRRGCPTGADTAPLQRTACPSLQEAMRLIQEEFAFDGYLDNGLEALIMGEYIFALKDLTYATFCSAISEKFCDLYWDEKLLQSLFKVVNRTTSPSESVSEEARQQPEGGVQTSVPSSCSPSSRRPSGPRPGNISKALSSQPEEQQCFRGGRAAALQKLGRRGACTLIQLESLPQVTTMSSFQGKEKPAASRTSRAPCSPTPLSDVDSAELSRGNFEVGFRPQRSVKAEKGPAAGDSRPCSADSGSELASEGSDSRPVAQLEEAGLGRPRGPAEFHSCSPGWSSAFYEADCFGTDVLNYVEELRRQKASGAVDTDAQHPELEQQLMMEKRTLRKALKFHQKLLHKEERRKGSEVRTMLSKLKGQLEETKSKVQFLGLVKKYLQVAYAERWGLEPSALPVIVNIGAAHCGTLDFSPLDESSSLIFYNVNKPSCGGGSSGRQRKARVLQAGTPLGLMAYLYSSNAFLEGYVQQFLYTFRYFCTPHDLLQFLLDRISGTLSRAHQEPSSTITKIYKRSFCLLQAWVEECYAVDFRSNSGLCGQLRGFLSSKITPLDSYAEHVLALLEVSTDQRGEGTTRGGDLEDLKKTEEDTRPLNALCKKFSEDGLSRKSFPWRLAKGTGLALGPHKERPYTIASALPKPCFLEEFYGPYAKAGEKGPYFLTEYSTQQLFTQLTLLQQELFQKCHPVHFLNSRALGVVDKGTASPAAISSESLSASSLFLPNYTQDQYLLRLLRNAEDVSTWVAAEIVTSHTSKLQVNLLSKFLLIAKSCYEQRNFATAMQILGGLEHLVVRQSPAWRILPAKIAEVVEELKAVEVFLKSDSLCLMEGRRFRTQPTIPSARLLAMHVQQLETGGFTMTNGAHRWSKLRNIAKVASQVHAFQENPYTFAPDPKLQSFLRQRIARFSGTNISILAADSRASVHQVASEKHSHKIQDKLRRMKATFQ